MMIARIDRGQVVEVQPFSRVWTSGVDPDDLPDGWVTVVDTRPEPPDGQEVAGLTVQLVEGVPTVVWIYREIPPPTVEQVNEQTIRTGFTVALARSAQIKTQMDTIQGATLGNVTACSTAIKSISEAVEDLNTVLRKLIRLVDNRLDSAD